MTVHTDVRAEGDTVKGRFSIKVPTVTRQDVTRSAYAFAGLADLAIEQVKEAPAAYVAEVRKAQDRLAEVPKALPGQVQDLREQAGDLYAQLAVRGQRLVTQIRRQPATEAAIVEGREAVKKAEAAATAARKSVKAAEKAVSGAAGKIG